MISSEDKFKAIEKIHNTRLNGIKNKVVINNALIENIIDFVLSGKIEELVERLDRPESELINIEFVSIELEKELGNTISEHWNNEYIERAYAKNKILQTEMWETSKENDEYRKFESIYLYSEKDGTYVLYEIIYKNYAITIKIIGNWFILDKDTKLDMVQIWNKIEYYDLTEIDTIGTTDYSREFMSSTPNVLDISTWDFRNVKRADGMFQFMKVDRIILPDLKYINFDKLESIKYIFADIVINDEISITGLIEAYNKFKCKNRKFIEDFEALSPQYDMHLQKLDKTCYEGLNGSRHCMKNIDVGVVNIHDFNEIMKNMFIDTIKEWGECDKQTLDKLEHIGERKIHNMTIKPLSGLEHIKIRILDLREIKINKVQDFYSHSYFLQNLNKKDEERINGLIKHMYYYILIHMIPSIKGIYNRATGECKSNMDTIFVSDSTLEKLLSKDIKVLNAKIPYGQIVHIKTA